MIRFSDRQMSVNNNNIGALIITYAILGVPYYNYGMLGPQTLALNEGPLKGVVYEGAVPLWGPKD